MVVPTCIPLNEMWRTLRYGGFWDHRVESVPLPGVGQAKSWGGPTGGSFPFTHSLIPSATH